MCINQSSKIKNRVTKYRNRHRTLWIIGTILYFFILESFANPYILPSSPYFLNSKKDYIYPSEIKYDINRIKPLQKKFKNNDNLVEYTAFDDKTYNLIRYTGEHISVLFPPDWEDGLTTDQVKDIIYLGDIIYERYLELIGKEPQGDALLSVAFVPDTCGWGCGHVGSKGIEILSNTYLERIKNDLEKRVFPGVALHEMAHNFDIFWNKLHYLPDHSHAWTSFMGKYIPYYSQMGSSSSSSDELMYNWLNSSWKTYRTDSTSSWSDCVLNEHCIEKNILPNDVWAGFTAMIGILHGSQAIKDAMKYLGSYNGVIPITPQEKERLHIESLAIGAKMNLDCYLNKWRWHSSKELSDKMKRNFGSIAPLCDDHDNDGISIIEGDCDDISNLNSEGIRYINGIGDNCNILINKKIYKENLNTDFSNEVLIDTPAKIVGNIQDIDDEDYFIFQSESKKILNIELCSITNFKGWIFLYNSDGSWNDYQWVDEGGCTLKKYHINEARSWKFGVMMNTNSNPGNYTIKVNITAAKIIGEWIKVNQPTIKGLYKTIFNNKPTSSSEVELTPLEGDINHISYFLLQLNKSLNRDASVDYRTEDGTAKAGEDYIYSSGTATIHAGETYTAIGVMLIGDNLPEPDETFSLIINNPSGANFPLGINEIKASKKIINDD